MNFLVYDKRQLESLLKVLAFLMLVTLMVMLAGHVGHIATTATHQSTLSRIGEINMDIRTAPEGAADTTLDFISPFCYKACGFIRPE